MLAIKGAYLLGLPTLINVAAVTSTLASRSIQPRLYLVSIRTNFGDTEQT